MNFNQLQTALWTLVVKEIRRFMRIWPRVRPRCAGHGPCGAVMASCWALPITTAPFRSRGSGSRRTAG